MKDPSVPSASDTRQAAARLTLNAWVREVVEWHFSPETGTPFWLEWAKQAGFDPRREVHGFDDLGRFEPSQDEWLRGGPGRRWGPRGCAGRPVCTFETGGSIGVPESRISVAVLRLAYG